jgi:hypothetical protein
VAQLTSGTYMTAGIRNMSWNAVNDKGISLEKGMYFYRIISGDILYSGKMILTD